MKKHFSTSRLLKGITFLFFINCYSLFSQTVLEENSNKGEQERLLLAVSELNQAMVNRDKETLSLRTMEELSYGHSNGKIENKKAFIDEIISGDFDFISTDTENQSVFFSGENIAVVRHIFIIEALNKGEKVHIRIGNMMVLKKLQNQWRLLARQAYKL